MDITFECATLDDADVVGRITALSWQQAYRGIVPAEQLAQVTPELRAARFRQFYPQMSGVECTLALADGEPVGVFTVQDSRDEDTVGFGEIGIFYLLPEAWGRGIGSAAMAEALRHLQHKGYKRAMLWVFARNDRARCFYEKHGFAADGASKTWRAGEDLEEVRYRRDL